MGWRQTKSNEYFEYKDLSDFLINRAVIPGTSTQKNYPNQNVIKYGHILATGGAGATLEHEDTAGETLADIGKTELTLVLASDTDDNAYDTETVTVYYKNAAGEHKACQAEYNSANSTTEVAFTDLDTGLIAVTDFYCFDTETYGLACVVSSVAVQAGDNVCIGSTGCVAGIADPTTCVCIILAAATSPTAANIHGVGDAYGSEAANQADTGYLGYLEYVTPSGDIKNGIWTFPADSSVATRFVSVEDSAACGATVYVQDFYRRREFYMDHAAIDECRVCNFDKSAIYAAIEIANDRSTHSRHMVPNEDTIAYTYLRKIIANYATVTEACTLKISFTPYGQIASFVQVTLLGGYTWEFDGNIKLEPLSEVKIEVTDDAATGGDFSLLMDIVEAEV